VKAVRFLVTALLFVPDRVAGMAGNVATALIQIWSNKIRSLLTVLGIIIAVTSIITVVSMVEGFGDYVTNFLRGLGTNMMVVYPERVRGPRGEFLRPAEMTIEDIQAVDAHADAIRRTSPVIFSRATIEYGRQQLTGIDLRCTNDFFQAIRNFYVDTGRFFGAVDVDAGTPSACSAARCSASWSATSRWSATTSTSTGNASAWSACWSPRAASWARTRMR